MRICGEMHMLKDAFVNSTHGDSLRFLAVSLVFFRHSTISMLLEGLTAAIFIKALFFTLPGKLSDLVPSPLIAPMGAFDARY